MKNRVRIAGVLSSAVVLIVGWQIGTHEAASTTVPLASGAGASTGAGTPASSGTSKPSTSASPGASASPSPSAPASGSSGAKDGSFTGAVAPTAYGPMQVAITISGGKLTDVKAVQVTDFGGRSQMISNYATPILRTEALSAQSAKIQAVSGATYTSEGYIQSLQSALNEAGL